MTNELLTVGIASSLFGTFLSLSIIFYVFLVIAYWRIFTKAGEKGWKSLIPIYNVYITFKLFWKPSIFWLTILIGIIGAIPAMLTNNPNVIPELNTIPNIALIFSTLSIICSIFEIYVSIELPHKMAKSFGKGIGFTLGLIFLPNIFELILGFGSAQYTKHEK